LRFLCVSESTARHNTSTAGGAGAIQSRTDFGTDGYGGPCPPQGDKPHHYIFTVYAVDEDKLQFAKDHNVSAAVVGFELHFHSKAKASLTATYGR
jgi:Raf kinase inhibitor-like YbhB/YbcL family protein